MRRNSRLNQDESSSTGSGQGPLQDVPAFERHTNISTSDLLGGFAHSRDTICWLASDDFQSKWQACSKTSHCGRI